MDGRLAPSRLSGAFAMGRPELFCFITAADCGGIASNPGAPVDASVAML